MRRYKIAITYVAYADSEEEALDMIENDLAEAWDYETLEHEEDDMEDILYEEPVLHEYEPLPPLNELGILGTVS